MTRRLLLAALTRQRLTIVALRTRLRSTEAQLRHARAQLATRPAAPDAGPPGVG